MWWAHATLAIAHLSGVEMGGIAEDLRYELEQLTPEDVWERSGNSRHGYVETGEAAEQVIEEVLEPYLEEMRKYHKRRRLILMVVNMAKV